MAVLVPSAFPHDLAHDRRREGEAVVFEALREALGDSWRIYYDRRVPGAHRPIDFLVIHPQRKILALEVKGGLVHFARKGFRQAIGSNGRRKRIDPFQQTKTAWAELMRCTGLSASHPQVHFAACFPLMSCHAFPWAGVGPHVFVREDIADANALRTKIEQVLEPGPDFDPALNLALIAHLTMR